MYLFVNIVYNVVGGEGRRGDLVNRYLLNCCSLLHHLEQEEEEVIEGDHRRPLVEVEDQ